MPHSSPSRSLLGLARSFGKLDVSDPLAQCLAPRLLRSFASQTTLPADELTQQVVTGPSKAQLSQRSSHVVTTIHSWPHLEPTRFAWYHEKLLNLPLRKDLLHRAVIYEGDSTRQGTASSKWRSAVHGSNRKIQPQKGLGRARAGDKKSPIRRGGGKAFGPHPRDFSTVLQRKVYDIAWRTALSHRYRKGELLVVQNQMTLPELAGGRFLHNFFETNQWGRGHGRSLLVTAAQTLEDPIVSGMAQNGEHGMLRSLEDVDVKNLLETGRVIIEQQALEALLLIHSSDLGVKADLTRARLVDESCMMSFLEDPRPMDLSFRANAEQALLEELEEFDIEEELAVEDTFEDAREQVR